MSASVMHSAPIYAAFGRMHSVEELDSSLTLLSRHNVLTRTMPITPPGTPVAQSPDQHFEYSADSPSTRIPPNTPVTPGLGPLRVSTTSEPCVATANGAPPPNIDNKIEQAMDLVKTHLTFAVREEIDFLRQTIVELEAKIQVVENENQLLRQYAPAEVVNNLATLVAQQKAQNGPSTTPSAIATASAIAAKVQPSSFCSTELANTLNNVVADVRQSIRNPNPQ